MLTGNGWTDMSSRLEEVEHTAKFIISSFAGVKVVKSGHLVQGWDGAAKIGGDAAAWVADKKCEVELLQDLLGDDGWVFKLSLRVVWVRSR